MAVAIVTAPGGVRAADTATIQELSNLIRMQQEQINGLKSKLEEVARQAGQAKAHAQKAAAASGSGVEGLVHSNGKLKVALKGHVNRAALIAGDGEQSDVFHVDNDTEPTLFNITATVAATKDLTIGAQIEAQLASNPSNAVSQNTENTSTGSVGFTERHLEVFFDSQKYGKLSLGQGNTASEGASEVDFSGTNVVIRSNFGTFGGGILFRNSATNALSTVSIGSVLDNFDGLSRDDRVRYDTPTFAGFSLSGSALQGGATDIALRYAGDFGGTKVGAAMAVANRGASSSTIKTQWSGSGSILFENGFSLTAAGGVRDMKSSASDSPVFLYGKLGYQRSIFDFGKSAISLEHGVQHDLAANGDTADFFGIGATQKLEDWGTELYAGFRLYRLDRTGASFDNIPAGMVGAMVKF